MQTERDLSRMLSVCVRARVCVYSYWDRIVVIVSAYENRRLPQFNHRIDIS